MTPLERISMQTSKCDCEHLNCELGSLRFPAHHKAGACNRPAAIRIERHGIKATICAQCELRWRETESA